MILDAGGQMPEPGVEGWPLGHRPGFEHTIDFQAEVIVQARGVVALHAKHGALLGRALARRIRRSRGLRSA